MKRIFAWILLVIMLVGTLAGCGCQKRQDPVTDPTGTTAPVAGDTNIQDVIEYLKAIYKDDGAETYVDFERFGIVRIAGVPYEVVWTVDVTEDLVKVVVNDDGTVTIDVNEKCDKATPYVLTATVTGEDGSTASHSWNYILPEAVDMVSIVKAAYALKNGESMDYEVTLTGEITMINTPYSEEYKNITVTIAVEGAEDMPIECYRLKGDGADELQIGDTITVTGTLKNYNGTIEFDAGCILESVVPGERVKAPDDPKQIVDEAYALGANQSLKYEATLTGKITQIKDPYSDQYKNITVVMVVAGRENKPITCYRMKGTGADDLDVGDTITVKGYITNYVGSAGYSTIEFTAGCQLISYENTGKEFIMPGTAAGIVNLAYSLKDGEALPEKATLTGVVTTVDTAYSSQYKNVTVTMVVGDMYDKPITCYRLKGTGADVIDEGYTITVTGILKNYKGKIEFDSGCTLDKYTAPAKPEGPAVSYEGTVVDAPAVDKPYKLGLVQGNISGEPTLYFSGNVANTYYLSTSKDGAKAVDVMLKTANGGYYLAFTTPSGATKYINMTQVTTDKLHTNLAISDKAETVYTYDTALKTLTVKMPDGKTYYIGTYSEYTTLSASDVSKINGSFPVHFMELKTVSGPASMEEGVKQLKTEYPNGYKDDYSLPTSVQVRDDVFTITWKVVTENAKAVAIKGGKLVFERQVDEVPYKLVATLTKGSEKTDVEWEYSVPRKPAAIEVVTNPEIGKAYRLALTQENLGGSVLFLTGERDGNYFATSDKSYEGVDVYAEKAGAGYRIYFMDDGVKTYVDMYEYQTDKIGVAFNTTLTETSAIYKIDTEKKALIATFDIGGTAESRYLGTYNTFNTMSSGKIFDGEIDGFPAMFVIVNEETPVTLNAAAQELQNKLPDTGSKTPSGFELPTTVTLNKTTFQVTWSITPASDAAKVTVTGDVCNVELTKGFEDVDYTLKATIKDPANQTKEVTWEYTVPAKGVSTIAQALAGETDQYFEVKGVVTLLDGKNVYIQDATGGICLYFAETPTDIALGDTVIGTGNRTDFYGLPELKNATFEKTTGMTLTSKQTTYSDLTTADLCTYVKLTGLTVTEVYDNNGSYSTPNITVKDAQGQSFQLYKAQVGKTGGEWDVKVGDVLDVTGAIGISYDKLVIRTTSAAEITVVSSGSTEPSETTTEPSTEPSAPANVDIATALAGEAGATFTVKGVVTLVDSSNIYVQDATGAICVRMASKPTDINLGDTIIGTVVRADYNGLPQLGSGTYEKSSGMGLSAETTTIDALTTADICTYVKLTGLTVTKVDDLNGTSSTPNIDLEDAAGNKVQIYKAVIGKTGDAWDVKVGDVIDVNAAVGYFNKFQLRNTSATEITVVSSGSTEPSETTTEPSDTTTEPSDTTTEPSESTEATTPAASYTVIDRIADLTAGTYKMGTYSVGSNDKFAANPYHMWDGTLYKNSSNYDMATNTYKFENNELVKVVSTDYASDKGDAADVQVVAVDGKTNTYYIMVGEQYLGLSDATNNRRFTLSDTACEWVATDHGTGGILMTATVGGANASFGASTGTSNVIRSYKESSAASSVKYGVIFFRDNNSAAVPTLDDAEAALKEQYPNGYDTVSNKLPTKVTIDNVEFTIDSYAIANATNAEAVKIEDGALVFAPQMEEVTYDLTMVITDSESQTKTVTFTGNIVPAKEVLFANGTYLLWVDGSDVAFGVLSGNYGYMPKVELDTTATPITGFTAAHLYTLTNNADGTICLQDSNGKYIYMTGTYNNFNVSATKPDEGADWILTETAEGAGTYYITNAVKNKTICFDASYNTFGSYSDVSGKDAAFTLTAVNADNITYSAEMAAAAFKAGKASVASGDALVSTYAYEGVEFTVTWNLQTANAAAAFIENGVFKTEAQAEDVEYTLTATFTNGEDTATATWTGTVAKIPTGDGDTNELAKFTFGEQGATGHVDGNAISEGSGDTWTSGSYALTFTNFEKIYFGGKDETGIPFIKFGTSSVVGTLSFTVEDDVDYVVVKLSGYKAKTSKYTINGGEAVTLTKSSNNGEYEEVTIDTSTNKTVTIATVSGAARMVMSEVAYYKN